MGSAAMESVCTSPGTGVIVDSGMKPVLPETRELKEDSKAEMADWAMPSAIIFVCFGVEVGAVVRIEYFEQLVHRIWHC